MPFCMHCVLSGSFAVIAIELSSNVQYHLLCCFYFQYNLTLNLSFFAAGLRGLCHGEAMPAASPS